MMMMRNARYNVLDDENTVYDNHHELTTFAGKTTDEYHPVKPSEYDQAEGHRLRRFYFRALVGVLGPILVCAYLIVIWRVYIVPIDPESPLMFGRHNAKWIFYSWFVAGVIGLGLSLYGLTGVEAGMLMEPTWNIGDATRLMLHADNTWSGPGGWVKTLNWAVKLQVDSHYRRPSPLWFILCLPSVLVFIAWPLSGLTMDIDQGYRSARVSAPVTMAGFHYDVFNERGHLEALDGAFLTWKAAVKARIPGVGIVYTPEGYDRSQAAFLKEVPTVFPKNDGVPTVFLTGQAKNPTEGKHWGLLLRYNCSIVNQAEDFKILNRWNHSWAAFRKTNRTYIPLNHAVDNKSSIRGFYHSDGSWARNMAAVIEFGFDPLPNRSESLRAWDANCYMNNNSTNMPEHYPGIDQERILEVALWQGTYNGPWRDSWKAYQGFNQNASISPNISDFFGAYYMRDFYSKASTANWPPLPMTAIGAQCRSSSSVGTADINGVKSSFSNFKATDTPVLYPLDRCARRFDAMIPYDFIVRQYSLDAEQQRWVSSLFTSSAAPPPFYAPAFSSTTNSTIATAGISMVLNFLQAEQLRQSMLHAYASYAVQLMYGEQGFTTSSGTQQDFLNPNVTEFESGTVLKPGVMPAVVPITLFCIWALVSSMLGIMYGFRRRWTETLDGHTMFRLGAELTDQERRELLKTSNTIKSEDCVALDDIPALVGDTKPELWLGRIGLVKTNKAKKDKLYE